MKFPSRIILCLFVLALVPGCASNKVAERQEYKGGKIPRPAHIWLYDLAATPADVPTNSALAGQPVEHATPQTAEQIEAGRRAGAIVAAQLVEESRNMGMPANPAGLIVGTGVKVYGEYSGSSKMEGRAKEAAKEIAAALKPKFQQQGWIE